MLSTLALLSALHAVPPADTLTGTWKVTGDVVGNPLNEVCTLQHSGATLTGSCRNADVADAKAFDVTGEVKDGRMTFSHGGDYQGTALTITFSGATTAPKALKGSIDVQPFNVSGSFTATAGDAPGSTPAKP